ncbi:MULTISPECIES: trimeric intracellular cation channel family protein [Paenibacillus]|uniref:Trimeric intracellular cation channel family protein n=2 Tax=Paenibacillus TaxID=44249 RepID=A0ABU3R7J9_9BACL|nr:MULTISPECIES: trimeric intracellular cation channel family protein [Paenibacillus]MCY9657413.1 trimeric intracellular cation channel family protein [Paenibacillus anseongense]MDU0200240.1 trimeric intracellular cation channel family protein [Paenibacillus sp. PFR10]MEB4799128.1 trimeric intracellular cation channel family protein [Paenibacillus chondroitinus]MEC0270496.1 trimeric intracellular cation channel family protein [Paenibacillus anseongense]
MNWELFSIIGTIAFAVSGAIVAMEEEYDILGVYVLGLVTAFGGGVIRNLLIGKPVVLLWEQGLYFQIALFAMTLVFLMPVKYIRVWKTWEAFFDAIGLAAFSIQGAFYATNMGHPLSAVIVAAVLTGIGGGMVRDVLAGRKPLVLKDEIYAVWGMLAGALVGLGWSQGAWQISVLFALIVILRMLSVFYKWKLPKRSLRNAIVGSTRRSDS